jgi:hypothetical protein
MKRVSQNPNPLAPRPAAGAKTATHVISTIRTEQLQQNKEPAFCKKRKPIHKYLLYIRPLAFPKLST